jgi:hypothetical protein
MCAGTVEENVDRMLEHKRELAAKVVTGGERWITELETDELRDLFALAQDVAPSVDDAEDPRQVVPRATKPRRRLQRREVRT